MAQHHDSSYKDLFSHAEMVKDLLQGFVHEPWVAELDFNSLERFNSNFISEKHHRREEDVLWRIKWRDRWLYLYLLIAFQSTDDTYMALRVMVYMGLLYQYLIREKKIKKGDKLPPVLPIVLYNGETPWKSKCNVQDLIEPVAGFEAYVPKLSYFLLDEQEYKDLAQLDPLKNLVSAIFQLEQSRTPQDIQDVVLKLLQWLNEPEQERIRRSFAVWLKRVILPRRLPLAEIPAVNSLTEVNAMLAERVQRWYDEAEAKGFAKGIAEGEVKGKAEGIAEGKVEGIAEGEVKGKAEGIAEGKAELLFQLLEIRFGSQSEALKQQLLGMSVEQLERGVSVMFHVSSIAEIMQVMENNRDE